MFPCVARLLEMLIAGLVGLARLTPLGQGLADRRLGSAGLALAGSIGPSSYCPNLTTWQVLPLYLSTKCEPVQNRATG